MAADPADAGSSTQLAETLQLLPIDKVFPIQIGSEVFKISGNALNSDSPSYFTQFFTVHSGENLRTLYIDRDPAIFKDIVRHLQGYLVTPRNEEHFVYLYSDAIYYKLPRLRQRLFRDFYVRIGDTSFQIPKELFNDARQKGDRKNFFSMGSNSGVTFSDIGFGSAMGSPFPDDKMFPQLQMENFDAEKQLRPPYLTPPKLSRSSANFDDILRYMQGYELDVTSDVHRRNLIKDSKFYNLRHLTEILTPAKVFHNPFRGNAAEILLSINDFRPNNSKVGWIEGQNFGWMEYKRPHDIDEDSKDLVVQIDDDGIVVGGGKIMLINRQAVRAVKTLKECAEGRKTEVHLGALNGGHEEIAIRIDIPSECYCLVDGEEHCPVIMGAASPSTITAPAPENGEDNPAAKRRKLSEDQQRSSTASEFTALEKEVPKALVLKRSIWRVKVRGQPPQPSPDGNHQQPPNQPLGAGRRVMIFVGVKLEGWTKEKEFSKEIAWL